MVCGGVLVLDNSKNPPARPKFKTPYLNARYVLPILYLAAVWIVFRYFREEAWEPFFSMEPRTNERGEIEADWVLFQHKLPMIFFLLAATALMFLSFMKNLSLIPVLGLLSCLYLMSQLGSTNWARFALWLIAGLAIYFVYSRKSSKIAALRKSDPRAS
jgi:hypothetical protein